MTTSARPTARNDSHWYDKQGNPQYEIMGKTTGKLRPVTLGDARKNDWVPSVTTILKVLAKPGLQAWIVEQACLAIITSPKKPDESIDDFVKRILHTEEVQDEERKIAAEKGKAIHDAMQTLFEGGTIAPDLIPWVRPAFEHIAKLGQRSDSEFIVVGSGYAGRVDLQLKNTDSIWLIDFKTTKKLPPKASWEEHRLQLSAYADAVYCHIPAGRTTTIRTGNLYISTVEPGKFVFHENPDPLLDYRDGFYPAMKLWQFMNDYRP